MQITREMLEQAGADARSLMKNCSTISALVGMEIIVRQLFLFVRHALAAEITNGWDVERPDLVIHALTASADCYAIDSPIGTTELRDRLISNVIPLLEIFVEMEQADRASRDPNSTPLP